MFDIYRQPNTLCTTKHSIKKIKNIEITAVRRYLKIKHVKIHEQQFGMPNIRRLVQVPLKALI